MLLKQNTKYVKFQSENGGYTFLPTGDIFEFECNGCLLNQFRGNPKDGSANNIWLRVYNNECVNAYPMLGITSHSKMKAGKNTLVYIGEAEGVDYKVTFFAAKENLWYWNVELEGHGKTVDVIYGQDIGVAAKGGVLTNELYMAQYLDHKVFDTERGFVICSRQNQENPTGFPYLQQGMIQGKAVGYATDGMQFFGLNYKATQIPAALSGNLPNKNYQYECSYIALQTEKVTLNGNVAFTFYGLFKPTHTDAVRELEFTEEVLASYEVFQNLNENTEDLAPISIRKEFGGPYCSPKWSKETVDKHFPYRKLEEEENGVLLSFFTDNHVHVVLQDKELMVERPHGTIITSKMNPETVDTHLISSTNYIYGLFNGQTLVGNTNQHKLISTPRGLLNNIKSCGQRLYVKIDGQYRLLTLPAAFEMGMNSSRWYYVMPDGDLLVISSFTVAETSDLAFEVQSASNKKYDFIITNQLVMGDQEFLQDCVIEELDDHILRVTAAEGTFSTQYYPGLHFDIQFPGTDYSWSDDRIFFEDGESRNGTLLTVSISDSQKFQMIIQGRLEESDAAAREPYCFDCEAKKFIDFYSRLNNGFHLESDSHQNECDKLNETAWWYSHNAMVHFAVPHGLEQPGGAAWGTRDVCQGPMEFFMMTQNYKMARVVLLNIYGHQIWETQEWPQWFMFDNYPLNAGDCHGDVVHWPLKCISDYLCATNDYSILEEKIPYLNLSDGKPGEHVETLLEHVKRAAATIEKRFLDGTSLISYAGGDWDDTLQPADEAMKEKLVSAWTVALCYQVVRNLGTSLAKVDPEYAAHMTQVAKDISASFHKLLIEDNVIAGFVCREDDGSFRSMLHPNDDKTGIHYRLLPMTRSIIAELVDSEQAKRNLALIDEHLKCPDGVRLMDHPTQYDGGVSHLFVRAEQAANIGREISLQYTHAHIRYIEAMAKLGLGDRAWEGLFQINPINIKEAVPNALRRQSNMYFSSSEGTFNDRYEYSADFDKLRDGSIDVKGGWRLYSSGPGIYMNQLISNVLGIRFAADALIIDPALPQQMDGLKFRYNCFGKDTVFVYHISDSKAGASKAVRNGKELAADALTNKYRSAGIKIKKDDFLAGEGEIHIYIG